MSAQKTLPQVQQAEERLLRLIPLALATVLVLLLWIAGIVTAYQRTLDQRDMVAQSPQFYVNINTDGEGELMLLPGVGRTIAQRILAYRKANGSFASIDQLVNITGINERTLSRLRPYLMTLPDDKQAEKKRHDATVAP